MKKADVISKVAEKAEVSKKDAGACIDALLETITEAMAADDSVAFTGFGTFSVAERAAREGRNPATGEKITIAASKTVRFKAGSKLKEAL